MSHLPVIFGRTRRSSRCLAGLRKLATSLQNSSPQRWKDRDSLRLPPRWSRRSVWHEVVTMYKPNFCAECGTKLLRLRWYFWTSRRFCNDCARSLRKARFGPALLAALALLSAGYVTGRARRPAAPPLIIVRRSDSPLSDSDPGKSPPQRFPIESAIKPDQTQAGSPGSLEEVVYLCGAQTKKGTPCSRRVHGPVRCWQHRGMPSMIPVVPIK